MVRTIPMGRKQRPRVNWVDEAVFRVGGTLQMELLTRKSHGTVANWRKNGAIPCGTARQRQVLAKVVKATGIAATELVGIGKPYHAEG